MSDKSLADLYVERIVELFPDFSLEKAVALYERLRQEDLAWFEEEVWVTLDALPMVDAA